MDNPFHREQIKRAARESRPFVLIALEAAAQPRLSTGM